MATPAIGYPLAGAFDSAISSQHAYGHAGRDARAAAVGAAWEAGNGRQMSLAPPSAAYAAAAAERRRSKAAAVQAAVQAPVVAQGMPTTTPLTPATSHLLYQTNAGRMPQPALAPSLAAPTFPGAPRVQHPLAAAFGQGSQMYATGVPLNGMPQPSTPSDSAVHIDGEFAGTFMDPITGVTYASYMLRDQAPTVQMDTPVMRLGEPSRLLEFLTGVSHVPKPVRTDVPADDWATIADGIQVPDCISRAAIRGREAQDAAAQVFFTRDNQEAPVNDTFWDGYVGDTYVLRTWTDTQTMSDNAEFNLCDMQPSQPDFSDTYIFANVGAHAGGARAATYTLAAPKPSLPGHATISMEDMGPNISAMAPPSERVGRAQLPGTHARGMAPDMDMDLSDRRVQQHERIGRAQVTGAHAAALELPSSADMVARGVVPHDRVGRAQVTGVHTAALELPSNADMVARDVVPHDRVGRAQVTGVRAAALELPANADMVARDALPYDRIGRGDSMARPHVAADVEWAAPGSAAHAAQAHERQQRDTRTAQGHHFTDVEWAAPGDAGHTVQVHERRPRDTRVAHSHHTVANDEWAGANRPLLAHEQRNAGRDAPPARAHIHVDVGNNWTADAARNAVPVPVDSTRDTRFISGPGHAPDIGATWEASPALAVMAHESTRHAAPFLPANVHAALADALQPMNAHAPLPLEAHKQEQGVRAHVTLDTRDVADWDTATQNTRGLELPARSRTTDVGHGRSTLNASDAMFTDDAARQHAPLLSERTGRHVQWTARADLALAAGDDTSGALQNARAVQAHESRARVEQITPDGRLAAAAHADTVYRPTAMGHETRARQQEHAHIPRALQTEPHVYDGGMLAAATPAPHAGLRATQDITHIASGRNFTLQDSIDTVHAAVRGNLSVEATRDTTHIASGRNMDGTAFIEVDGTPAVREFTHRLRANEHGETARPSAHDWEIMPTNRSLTQFRDVERVRDTTIHGSGRDAVVDAWHYARQAFFHPETHGAGAFTRETTAPIVVARPGVFEPNLAAAYAATDPGQRHIEAAAVAAAAASAAAAAQRAPIMDTTAVAYESAYDYETD